MFENPWVVGIGGGILSGFIVTLVTRYIFSKRDNREYLQKVQAVNREVVYALRPGISEGHVPDENVLDSLLNATARKYKVSRSDVFRPKQIAEELIKEIMDSSFISTETKKSYCETLAHMVQRPQELDEHDEVRVERTIVEGEYRRRLSAMMSATLGLTAGIITMFLTFSKIFDGPNLFSPFSSLFEVLLPTMAIFVAITAVMLTALSSKRIREMRDNHAARSSAKPRAEKCDG